MDINIANVAARNAARPATLRGTPEQPLFYKMDDEIINWIKQKPDFFNVDPNNISRVSQLDEKLLSKALDDWLENHPNHVILGRSAETSVARDAYSYGANQTSSMYGATFGYLICS